MMSTLNYRQIKKRKYLTFYLHIILGNKEKALSTQFISYIIAEVNYFINYFDIR